MREKDRGEVLAMMRTFYASPAVSTNGSEEIFRADIDACLCGSPYLEGFVLTEGEATVGYAMLARSFSTEFGKPCVWVEDLYLKPEHCEKGYGTQFLRYAAERYPEAILRLEVEAENARAVHVYRKNGYGELPYVEMKK
ncbi:MAG: GNAT family N-acetyltransferase [Oscillospiraceae bacterium]|nr:GNAT family N-acetyltransferase [Oscillospiraceae bacterium]